LKKTFTTTPILIHPNFSKPFFIEADASDFALGTLLLQLGASEKLHPVAFHLKKFSTAEINYKIYEKELLTIIDSFYELHHLLD